MSDPLTQSDQATAKSGRRDRLLRLLLLVGMFIQLTWMLNVYSHWRDANSSSRVYLTLAIVEQGTFQIDRCIEKYGDILDKAEYRGHRYSDKAPGTSFWFVPLAWLLRALGVVDMRALFFCLRLFCVSIPTIGFWWYTLPWFREWSGREDRALAIVASGGLGTNFLIFSTQLFAHVPAAWCLFLAFLAARRLWTAPVGGGTFGPALLAGGLAGLAFLNDYVVMLAVAALGSATLAAPRLTWRQPLGFGLGLAPAIALWMAYNWVCFGHPLQTGFIYHSADFYGQAYRSGFLGIQPIDPSAPIGMLLSPARGMLFLSPFLVMAPIGWWRQIRSGVNRADAVLSAMVFGCLFLFAMTTVDWRGGWGIGTRYLTPAVPFLLVGVAGAVRGAAVTEARSIVFAGLAAVGVLLCALAAATVSIIPQEGVNPLYSLDWPLARDGYFAPHLTAGMALPWLTMAPYVAAVGVGLLLIFAAGPARTVASRIAAAAASAVVAVVVIAGQCNISEEPAEQLAGKFLRIDSLASLGYYDDAAQEMLDLLAARAGQADGQRRVGGVP